MTPHLSLDSRVFSFLIILLLSVPNGLFCALADIRPDSTASDSLPAASADSSRAGSVDRLKKSGLHFDSALDSLSRGILRSVPADLRPSEFEAGPSDLARAVPVYLDGPLNLAPGMLGVDSLGNGFPTGFNWLGSGFDQVRVSLDGMPLVDPLTGAIDYRAVNPDILRGFSLSPGTAARGPYGGAARLELESLPDPQGEPQSRLGLSGGSYQVNRLGGGLNRGLFGRGALHVDINKVQQSSEDFRYAFEQIQYFTRLEQSLGRVAVLTMEGLYFSDARKAGFGSPRLKNANTFIQAALAGRLDSRTTYFLAWRHSSSQHPWQAVDESWLQFQGTGAGYSAGLERQAGRSVQLGVGLEGEYDRVKGGLLAPEAVWNHLLAGHARLDLASGFKFGASGGYRISDRTADSPVLDLNLVRPARVGGAGFSLSVEREVLTPSLISLSLLSDSTGRADVSMPVGRMTRAAANVEWLPSERTRLSAGLFILDLARQPHTPILPDPYSVAPLHRVDLRTPGVRYRIESPLFRGLLISAQGRGLLKTQAEATWLPQQSHSAALSRSGEFFRHDMGYSIQAEMRYDSDYRFVAPGGGQSLVLQPSRVDFGGTATLRIIDFIVYGRLDHLLGNYYNNTDPLRLPAPRVVVGINWMFYN